MPTQRNTLVGNYAVCTVGGVLVAQLVDWAVTIRTRLVDATAHGDYWDVNLPLGIEWTARIGGFLTEASQKSFLSAYANGTAPNYEDPGVLRFIGYNDHLSLGTAKRLFEGDAFVTEGTITLPDGMSRQEITFEGTGSPTFIGS